MEMGKVDKLIKLFAEYYHTEIEIYRNAYYLETTRDGDENIFISSRDCKEKQCALLRELERIWVRDFIDIFVLNDKSPKRDLHIKVSPETGEE